MKSLLKRIAKTAGIYTIITLITLAVLDLLLIGLNLFPPAYDTGDPKLGWATNAPEAGGLDWCLDLTNGERVEFARNDLGIRTNASSSELRNMADTMFIAAVGDSHSDLCAPNSKTHQGVLEYELNQAGLRNVVLSNGVGRYSPLQSYILFEERLDQFNPDALVMNLYTGNDFIDILRSDDRPHFTKRSDDTYEIFAPEWFRYYDPDVEYRSRVLYLTRTLLDKSGVRPLWIRFRLLNNVAGDYGGGILKVFDYVRDIRESVEPTITYSGALSAQFLNQQLFFYHFPSSQEESVRRIDALMRQIRDKHPSKTLVMSPIPSYQLVADEEIDSALEKVMSRMPIDNATAVQTEATLYDQLQDLSKKNDWVFINNLDPMKAHGDADALYNKADYHLTTTASRIIGQTEAELIGALLSDGAVDGSDNQQTPESP